MTTEQATGIIKMLLGYLKGEIEPPKQETIEEARAFEQQGYECLEMAIKALEQQPCEDAVSRQAILSYICNDLEFGDEENGCNLERKIAQEEIYNFVKKMPPVTPKEKTGHWYIREMYSLECNSWECSECKEVIYEKTKYCPNCGARMAGDTE